MRVELRIPRRSSTRKIVPAHQPRPDDVRSILRDVCGAIAQQTEFVVAGFGQDPWPVDVATDLPVFLEQLPRVLDAVASSRPAVLEFYAQGNDRRLRLSPAGDFYSVACTSFGEWQPDPDVLLVERAALQRMLLRVRDEFVRSVKEIAPSPAEHAWLREWLKGEHGGAGRLRS